MKSEYHFGIGVQVLVSRLLARVLCRTSDQFQPRHFICTRNPELNRLGVCVVEVKWMLRLGGVRRRFAS